MLKRLRVALLIESSRAHGRDMLYGVAAYARGRWSIYYPERVLSDAAPPQLRDWKPDGIIARIGSRELQQQIKKMHLPTVDLCDRYKIKGVPRIETNHRATAQLAANHLLECGLTHFAYCGFSGLPYSDERCTHFVRHLAGLGHQCHVFADPHPQRLSSDYSVEATYLLGNQALLTWLRSLPEPVGIMACNDICAQQILDTCGENDITVPDKVAVIGVDNDHVLCDLGNPPLSSIDLNGQQAGYVAAATLERMIGGDVPDELTVVEPSGVVVRRSTDTLAIPDEDVAAAVRMIRKRACEGIKVRDVVEAMAVSPSTLERRFLKYLGRSPLAEIIRIRIREARYLLTKTNLSLAEIAQQTGFHNVECFCNLFKEKVGQTPGKYRKGSRML